MGEYTYELISPDELETNIYFLHCGYKVDEVSAPSFDHGQDHRTQTITIRERGGVHATSKGALISKGGIMLMEITLFFLYIQLTFTIQQREDIERALECGKGVMIWREAAHR